MPSSATGMCVRCKAKRTMTNAVSHCSKALAQSETQNWSELARKHDKLLSLIKKKVMKISSQKSPSAAFHMQHILFADSDGPHAMQGTAARFNLADCYKTAIAAMQ